MFFYYWIVFSIFILYIFIYSSNIKSKDKVYIILSFLLLIVISGIRGHDVGGDLQHYLPNYEIFGKQSLSELFANRTKYGYVYALICKIAHCISSDAQSFLFVTSLFNLSLVAYFIKIYSPQPWLSIYIYITMAFYTNTFNSVRSSMALAMGLFMMQYIIKRRLGKFVCCYLIALEIHQTFFPFILLYFLYEKKVTLKYIVLCVSVCFVFSQASNYMTEIATIAYLYDPGAYTDIGESYSGGYILLALLVGMTIGFYFINRKVMCGSTQLFLHCMIMASCIQAFATYYTVLQRVSMFFYVVVIVLFPITLNNLNDKMLKRWGYLVSIVLFFIYFEMFVMTGRPEYQGSNSQGTLPYKTFLER